MEASATTSVRAATAKPPPPPSSLLLQGRCRYRAATAGPPPPLPGGRACGLLQFRALGPVWPRNLVMKNKHACNPKLCAAALKLEGLVRLDGMQSNIPGIFTWCMVHVEMTWVITGKVYTRHIDSMYLMYTML